MQKRTMTRLGLVLVGILALTLLPQHPQRVSAQPAATGTIAYVVSNDTTGDEIWLINPDGSNNHKIYSTGVADVNHILDISGLAWRPNAGELVFASNHESACSWYDSDLFAIQPDGSGYRRVTNAPACAGLASYPKGTVTVALNNLTAYGQFFLYVQGAPGVKLVTVLPGDSAVVQFTDVADLGSTLQPVVAINGTKRWYGGAAADVKPGQTVDAGMLMVSGDGTEDVGAYRPAWRSDNSRVGYAQGCSQIYQIADNPPAGSTGQPLLNNSDVSPCSVAWGPTAGTANQILYYQQVGDTGIFQTTEGSTNAGTKLVSLDFYQVVLQLEYLPDGSGFLFSAIDNFTNSANIYLYDVAGASVTQLTNFTDEYAQIFSISPDGQQIVFERAASGAPFDLWTMGIDGSNLQLLVHNGAHPAWSHQPIPVQRKTYLPLVLR